MYHFDLRASLCYWCIPQCEEEYEIENVLILSSILPAATETEA
jgi:hypothetical protein